MRIRNVTIRSIWAAAEWKSVPKVPLAVKLFVLVAGAAFNAAALAPGGNVPVEALPVVNAALASVIAALFFSPPQQNAELYAADGNCIFTTNGYWANKRGSTSWFSEQYSNIEYCAVRIQPLGRATVEFGFREDSDAGGRGMIKKHRFFSVRNVKPLIALVESKGIPVRPLE